MDDKELDVTETGERYKENKQDQSKGHNESITRKPRRERVQENKEEIDDSTIILEKESDHKPRRRREHAGEIDTDQGSWMTMNTGNPNLNKTKKNVSIDTFEDEPKVLMKNLVNKNRHLLEAETEDIMDIPDLDEEETDQRVSQAPKYIARKIPTLKELENDVNFINTLDEDGIDLGYLLEAFVPSSQLIETDSQWTFEDLLREVTDELNGTQKTVIGTIIKEPFIRNPSLISNNLTKQKFRKL